MALHELVMEHSATDQHSPGANDESSRQRAKQACEPCRTRKRKCDGLEPCSVCSKYEYDCYYGARRRKRARVSVDEDSHQEDVEDLAPKSAVEEGYTALTLPSKSTQLKMMEANAGVRFPQLLSRMLSSNETLPKMQSFAWNLGVREYVPSVLPSINITTIISEEDAVFYSDRFFAEVHPHYGILDREEYMDTIHHRWENSHEHNPYDAIVCGVVALGSLCSYNNGFPREFDLITCSRAILESSILGTPTVDDVTAWVLRVIYLRCTFPPHPSWIASCSSLHVIEATGIHLDAADDVTVYGPQHPSAQATHATSKIQDRTRRLFWIARMFNTWISFECGRSRVEMPSATVPVPRARRGDHTPEVIATYKLSERLVPGALSNPAELEEILYRVEAMRPSHDKITLSKANLMMTIYRRLRVFGPCLSKPNLDAILFTGAQGLDAARRLAEQGLPWWHIANVPFQFLCVLLAIDSRESMLLVPRAMRTLKAVAARFNTKVMQEALKTAGLLVRLSQKKKEEDIASLREGLRLQQNAYSNSATASAATQPGTSTSTELTTPSSKNQTIANSRQRTTNGSSKTQSALFPADSSNGNNSNHESDIDSMPWLDEINLNAVPDLANFDWDLFLSTGLSPQISTNPQSGNAGQSTGTGGTPALYTGYPQNNAYANSGMNGAFNNSANMAGSLQAEGGQDSRNYPGSLLS